MEKTPLLEQNPYLCLLLTSSMPSRLGIKFAFVLPSDLLFGVYSATDAGGQVGLRIFPKTNGMMLSLVHRVKRLGTWFEPKALACSKTDLLCLNLFYPNCNHCS